MLKRRAWQHYLLYPEGEDWSGYADLESTWLVSFWGNRIELIRQADELSWAARQRPDLLGSRVRCPLPPTPDELE